MTVCLWCMHAVPRSWQIFLAIYLYHLVGQGPGSLAKQEYCHSNKKLAHQLHQDKPIICCADTKGQSISLTRGDGSIVLCWEGGSYPTPDGIWRKIKMQQQNQQCQLFHLCSAVITSLSCSVFKIWLRHGQRMDRHQQPMHTWPLSRTNKNSRE